MAGPFRAACATATLLALVAAGPAPAQDQQSAKVVDVREPGMLTDDQLAGRDLFAASCAPCHGTAGAGRVGYGPPLIHEVYEPAQHDDKAFVMAIRQGVRAHHWKFGNMPPQPKITEDEAHQITGYVRAVQQTNGIP